MSGRGISEAVPQEAAALRPWRIKADHAVHFTAAWFVEPYSGCEITIRRMDAFGMVLAPHEGPYVGDTLVDVLDKNGDIIQTFEVTKKGFEYLRQKLKAKREPSTYGEWKAAQQQEIGS